VTLAAVSVGAEAIPPQEREEDLPVPRVRHAEAVLDRRILARHLLEAFADAPARGVGRVTFTLRRRAGEERLDVPQLL
jgi:hypothetical protein